MALPKPDQRVLEAFNRLGSNPDFQFVVRYQQALYEHFKEHLIGASPVDIGPLQGRAAMLRDLLEDYARKPK